MPRPLEGELVRLRAVEESDAPVMYGWANDWETIKYLSATYPKTMQFEREWATKGDPTYGQAQFIAETLAELRPIGWIGLHDATPEDRAAGLGIAIGDHSFLGGGYGTDMMRTICRYGFEMMNLNRIELTVYDWNPRAIHVYEKVGFKHEGVLREGIFRMGRWNNLVYMSLLRGELK
ncbi:MAG: GNAT family N-acetyltransferase [Dehalococcoidia bacterium]